MYFWLLEYASHLAQIRFFQSDNLTHYIIDLKDAMKYGVLANTQLEPEKCHPKKSFLEYAHPLTKPSPKAMLYMLYICWLQIDKF